MLSQLVTCGGIIRTALLRVTESDGRRKCIALLAVVRVELLEWFPELHPTNYASLLTLINSVDLISYLCHD